MATTRKRPEPISATEGTTFPFTGYVGGQQVTRTIAVGPKCDSKLPGAWLCLTHPKLGAMPQFTKDTHLSTCRKPVLAWLCAEHGPEVP